MGGNGHSSSTSLAPGFRFHPTDEELISYYLKRKVCGKPFRFDAISEIEIYKAEPWDLPGLSKLKSRDLEWYFFSVLDKKYGNGSRTNRATVEGYWKTTGKDRPVQHKCRVVGMKKTLVFHSGRAPRGERTNWVMHEYKLADEELEKAGIPQESFALCRVFRKSGTGPKNGEQYGAPFVEEEWDNENEVASPPGETIADKIFVTKGNYLEQNHSVEPSENSAPSLNFYQGEGSNFVQESTNNVENGLRPFDGVDEGVLALEGKDNTKFTNLPMQPEKEATKSDHNAQPPIAVSHAPSDYQPEAQCFDNISSIDEGFFLEANDLSEPIEAHSTDFELDDYLTYFDADDDIAPYLNFDSSDMLDVNSILSDPAVNENLDLGAERLSISKQQLAETNFAEDASSFLQVKEAPKSKSDSNYPFMKQASLMLGGFRAPPAFASEFPTKDMVDRLHAAAQSSDSVHASTGMVNIRNLIMNNDNGMPWSFDKLGNLNVFVSFNLPLPEGDIISPGSHETLIGMASGKIASILSRSWFYLFFFWVMALAISAKLGTCIYSK
uniref:NAC transcription factor 6 n=1 Tax=Rheum palmatum TaxID=137221 RepID=A0AA50AFE1_RHEPA|nr:NAC transcription factor 6 [Rheum palmatum]